MNARALSKGFSFTLTQKELPPEDIIGGAECTIKKKRSRKHMSPFLHD